MTWFIQVVNGKGLDFDVYSTLKFIVCLRAVVADKETHSMSQVHKNAYVNCKTHFAGLLESPVMPPHAAVDTVNYKIFISGKTGVGKSSLAARLAGHTIPNMHCETTGKYRALCVKVGSK